MDFLWAVNSLAREVTKWNIACDKRMHRLASYMHHTTQLRQFSFVGDEVQNTKLALFVDASFAGDVRDSKSTSGAFLALVGPNTYCPIAWLCKKQTATSHSTTEAEIVALDAAIRLEGITTLSLWEEVIEVFCPNAKRLPMKPETNPSVNAARDGSQSVLDILKNVDYVPPSIGPPKCLGELLVLEDNDAVIKSIIKTRSPNLRHVARTHRTNLHWLFERFLNDPGLRIRHVNTEIKLLTSSPRVPSHVNNGIIFAS
jgi:hypothetical protein